MTLKTTKPGVDPDEFIKGAKADRQDSVSIPADDELFAKNYKTFPVKLPLALRDAAAEKAKVNGLSLHDYILVAIKEKTQK
jgi:hypothetical protein